MAKKNGNDIPFTIPNAFTENEFIFNLKAHGSNGYEWLIHNNEYALMIGNWVTPISRPSVMVTIRSETLWRLGVRKSIQLVLDYLVSAGGRIASIKLSRVDLCVDVILPESMWSVDLLKFSVSRCNKITVHLGNNIEKLQTIVIGNRNSPIMARLYDKPLEIKERSSKEWMFDVWGFNEVPEGSKIIGIEYQLRREILKQLGLETHIDLQNYYGNAWVYCTVEWLNFKDNPGKHQKNQRKTLPWWQTVQNGFREMQNPVPLIRYKAINTDEKQLVAQVFGYLSSLQALNIELEGTENPSKSSLENVVFKFPFKAKEIGRGQKEFNESVAGKRAKYVRSQEKLKTIVKRRKEFFGMNVN